MEFDPQSPNSTVPTADLITEGRLRAPLHARRRVNHRNREAYLVLQACAHLIVIAVQVVAEALSEGQRKKPHHWGTQCPGLQLGGLPSTSADELVLLPGDGLLEGSLNVAEVFLQIDGGRVILRLCLKDTNTK